MTLDPKILLRDEQANQDWPLLRLEAAKVLTPGPWKHDLTELRSGDYDNQVEDRICVKCRASEFKNQTDNSCAVPELSTDPMEILAERLVKKVAREGLARLDGSLWKAIGMVHIGEFKDREEPWMWFSLDATPIERAVCALFAIQGGKPFENEDVLWRWKPDGLGERVFAKNPSSVYGVALHCGFKNHWECALPTMSDIAELLRQLAAERARVRAEEVKPLTDALISLRRWVLDDIGHNNDVPEEVVDAQVAMNAVEAKQKELP